jgi:hypothetical protein
MPLYHLFLEISMVTKQKEASDYRKSISKVYVDCPNHTWKGIKCDCSWCRCQSCLGTGEYCNAVCKVCDGEGISL